MLILAGIGQPDDRPLYEGGRRSTGYPRLFAVLEYPLTSYTCSLTTMSENKPQFKHVPHGTNSPPLEANKPMGASCIAGTQQAGYVSDAEQRRGDFLLISRRVCLLIHCYQVIFPNGWCSTEQPVGKTRVKSRRRLELGWRPSS